MKFKELHSQESPVLICNVWDVVSAKAALNQNYDVLGTSSGAIASMLGYEDGEEISFQELAYIVERITKSVDLPLTVDLEAGYSRDPIEIAENIIQLSKIGVVGINIEDSIVDGERQLVDANIFNDRLEKVCYILDQRKIDMFVNVRTDTFLLNVPNATEETIKRANQYQKVGAKGLFVPCIENEKDIAAVIKGTELPLNVMCMPGLPEFEVLKDLGVKRISMGNFVFNKSSQLLENELKYILQNVSFKTLFPS